MKARKRSEIALWAAMLLLTVAAVALFLTACAFLADKPGAGKPGYSTEGDTIIHWLPAEESMKPKEAK